MKRYLFLLCGLIFLSINPLYGDDTDLFTARVDPNILIVMDNSASMNEVIYHESYDPGETYTGDGSYIKGRSYYFLNTEYKTLDLTLMKRLLSFTGDPVMRAVVLDMMEIILIGFIGLQQKMNGIIFPKGQESKSPEKY